MAGLVPAIHGFTEDIVLKTWMPGTSPGMTKLRMWHSLQAGTGSARATGFSMIGRLMMAETMPSATDNHQITS